MPEPSELNLDVKRITFRGCSGEEALIKRRLRNMEDLGKIGVVVMSKDEKTREYLGGNSLWWGWTLVSRGDVYTIQMVVFLKPKKASFLGEADQGSLYELDMADVAPWDGQVHVNARTAA